MNAEPYSWHPFLNYLDTSKSELSGKFINSNNNSIYVRRLSSPDWATGWVHAAASGPPGSLQPPPDQNTVPPLSPPPSGAQDLGSPRPSACTPCGFSNCTWLSLSDPLHIILKVYYTS